MQSKQYQAPLLLLLLLRLVNQTNLHETGVRQIGHTERRERRGRAREVEREVERGANRHRVNVSRGRS